MGAAIEGEPGVGYKAAVLALRDDRPSWGGRKLRRRLIDLGHATVPAASTITTILARHGRLDQSDKPRRVQTNGWISFSGRPWRIPRTVVGQTIALRPTSTDGVWDLVFIAHKLGRIDLRQPKGSVQPVTHLPEQA